MRRKFIAGNWKMFNGPSAAYGLVRQITEGIANEPETAKDIADGKTEVAVFPPAISLESAIRAKNNAPLIVGGQNIHWEKDGAYTGEISAEMLKESGCTHVIIGHSERRHIFGETNNAINKKLCAAAESGLISVFCIGELLEERESGRTSDVIAEQIAEGMKSLTPKTVADKIIIAYEPVWAIGTGKTADASDAQNVCSYIRKLINSEYGKDVSEKIIILYGGSVKPENAYEIMSQNDIDGLLIGGASLKAESFIKILSLSVSAKR